MMKNKKTAYLILAIAFVVFNVIALVIPIERTASFWIAYAFTNIAFVIQPVIWSVAFKNADTLKAKFLGIPIIHIGIVYVILQLVAFAVICITPIESWLSVVIGIVLLGFTLIGVVAASFSKKVISDTDAKVKGKVTYIKALQAEMELIADAEKDPVIKAELQKLTEAIRYSDPMSDDSLTDIENSISEKVSELKSADDKTQLISVVSNLIAERNKKCKLLK